MKTLILLIFVGLSRASPLYSVVSSEISVLPLRKSDATIVGRGTAPEEIIGFQRNAVESLPETFEPDKSQRIEENAQVQYGSQRIPLRDAIEALPSGASHLQSSRNVDKEKFVDGRLPLRDAVEHREAPFLGGVDHESIWIEPLAPPTLRRSQRIFDPNIVCHFDPRATNRTEPFTLFPGSIPSYKCTHLIYAGAILDSRNLDIVPWDAEYDEVKGGFKSVTGIRSINPNLRVLISIGLTGRGGVDFLSETVNSKGYSYYLKRISNTILNYVERHDFDGVVLEFGEPLRNSNAQRNLRSLLIDLRELGREKGLVLATSVGSEDRLDPDIIDLVDLAILKVWRENLRFGRNDDVALHPAPLRFVTRVVSKWIERVGTERASKIILGVPIFGQGYALKFGNFTNAGAPVVGPGIASKYIDEPDGKLPYYEICERLGEGLWISGRDEDGPYIKRGDQWLGYEDPITIKIKTAYVRSVGLGGVSLWSLDLDDFQGICGDPWPMLNSVSKTLGLYWDESSKKKCIGEGLFANPDNCSGFYSCVKGIMYHGHCGTGRFFDPMNARCVKTDPKICKPGYSEKILQQQHQSQRVQQSNKEFARHYDTRIVCYVTSWALYRKGDGKFIPERLDANLCTDVIYAFAGLNPDTLLLQTFDPWADIENNLYERVTSIKGPRILLALGGWTDSSGDKYSRLISDDSSRRKFAVATTSFLEKHGFDGLSVEWNYPKCWQSDCRKGPDSDKPNFTKFLRELKKEFDRQTPPLTLAVALSGYKEVIDQAYDVAEITQVVDFATVMTYDYHGAWESKTGHLAPLFATPGDSSPYYNVNFTMEYFVSLGAVRSKLLVGIPLYGQAYRLSNANLAGLGEPSTGPGTPGEFTRQPGMLAYYEICDRVKRHGWISGDGPSAHHMGQWVGYEDRKSVYRKGEYILQNGYGGAAMWTIDLDDFLNRCCVESFPLLKAINRALGHLGRKTTMLETTEDCRRPDEPITPPEPTMTTHSDAAEGKPPATVPMTTTTAKSTTWPSWTEKPSTTTDRTTRTSWPSWTWTPKPSTAAIATSGFTSTTTPRIDQATTIVSTTTTEKVSTPGAICNHGHYKDDPTNCGSYYRCVLGELKREQCAPGLHWDNTRNICDWPSIAKCQSKPDYTTATPKPLWTSSTKRTTMSFEQRPESTSIWSSTRSTTERHSTRVTTTTSKPVVVVVTEPTEPSPEKCEHGQYYSYPDSCTNFFVCVNGNLVSRQCGPGLNWNDDKKMCDWAYKNPCSKLPKKNALLVTKDMTSKLQACVPGSYTGVKGDCGSYKACLWGRQEIFRCAPGLHFNNKTHICDWPSRSNCNDEEDMKIDIEVTSTKPFNEITTATTIKTTNTPWVQISKPTTTPLPSVAIDPDKISTLSGYFKVVCYFTNWAWYRRGVGRYLPEYIDHTLCTHIVYGFAVLDYSELIIKAHDSWADYDNRFYERVVSYKKRGIKVLLALGGWNDSAGDKYSRLVNNPTAREKFIDHAIRFVEKYGFDGLDLDWEYPVCWQVDCKKGPASDKESFAALVRELSVKFKQKGLLLSAAVSPSKKVIDKGYDVPTLAKYLDWIAVMTYDFHGQWDKRTGHVAPLYYYPGDEFDYFNANYSINYWISKGAPPRSIVMGMPLYGQSFTINDPKAGMGLNAPASAGNAGEFTKAAGFLSYYEICDRINNRGWTVVKDPEGRIGPYAYKSSQWVSFDDAETIQRKAQLVRDLGLGGGMVWALDLDDFRGRCGQGAHPLMHTLQKVLSAPPNDNDKPIKPPSFDEELGWQSTISSHASSMTTVTTPMDNTTPSATFTTLGKSDSTNKFKVVCYFTNWAWYRQEGGKYLPEDIDPDLCTHVIYGFAVLDGTSLTIKSHDPWADIDNKFYERVVSLKSKGLKVLLAIGGWNDSAGNKYSRLVNSAGARRKFITHVLQFLEKYGFEGLDLDWEYPVCWQVDCKKGPDSDKESFALLVKELSDIFKPKGLLLSAAVSPSKRVVDAGYDVLTLAEYLDWISVMTYDYHGQWDKKTGHVAPLYRLPNDWEPTFNANFSIHYWLERGVPSRKLVMGVPLYGQSFSLAERSQSGLNAPTYGGGEAGEATRARGFLAYYEICERTLKKGWTVIQDSERRIGPYAYKSDQWVSFDDARQVELKANLIKRLDLGGGMIWALDLDDFKNRCGCEASPLLKTLNRVLRNYPKGPDCPVASSFITIDTSENFTTALPIDQPTTTTTYRPSDSPSLPVTTTTTSSTEDDTIEIEAVEPLPAGLPIGDCNGRLFITHKHDCSKYYLCNFGKLSERSCPNGLYWNENRCDWPENTKCKDRRRQRGA